jgi:methionyl-tRNA formyltransferase
MIFFGTSTFSIHVLDKLKELDIVPDFIVTVPDKPAGRKLTLTPPPVKIWANENNIKCLQFEKLDDQAVTTLKDLDDSDIFIVASYGKIIPQGVLDIPLHGCLNVHPSLLPKLRGATPLQTSILHDMRETGVTIIKMDAKMDHGPIVAMHEEKINPWPMNIIDLEKKLAQKGAELVAEVLPKYIASKAKLIEQDHESATFTKKIAKEDGLIESEIIDYEGKVAGDAGYTTYLKYQALFEWPGLYFFMNAEKNGADVRVKVKEAKWDDTDSTFSILKVTPEGKNEMTWKDFLNYISS